MSTQTAKLSLELATRMYKGDDAELRAFALENYPELGKDITERVKSYEDACKVLGINPHFDVVLPTNTLAYEKLKIIVKALNEGWTPNWDDSNEWKYYPWFELSRSGVGFSFYGCVYADSLSAVGSRLCFKSRELAEYAGKQFVELYKEYMTM